MRIFNLPFRNFSNIYFRLPDKQQKTAFLTFDDCSDIKATITVLNILDNFNIPASFFCIGKFLEKNYDILYEIIKNHTLGNHSYSHYNFFKVEKNIFLSDIQMFNKIYSTKYFRPPYGKISPIFAKKLLRIFDLKVILWSIFTYDYDMNVANETILKKIANKTNNGTIIVFHTNENAAKRLNYLLHKTIEILWNKNFQFKSIKI